MAEDTRLKLAEEPVNNSETDVTQSISGNTRPDIEISIQQPTARLNEQTEGVITSDDNTSTAPQDTLKVPDRHNVSEDETENEASDADKSQTVDPDQQYDTEDEEDRRFEEENKRIAELKKEMHEAVKTGDLFRLEDLLNNPLADIKMTLYNENLLVTALKAGEEFMSEFLIDNGVDYNFNLVYMELKEEDGAKRMEWYRISCRQLAFDRDMLGIVELIDMKNDNLFDFINPACRVPKIWQPKPVEIEQADETDGDEENDQDPSEIIEENKTEEPRPAKAVFKPGKTASVISDVDSGQYSGWKYPPVNKRFASDNNIGQTSTVRTTSQICLSPDEGYETTSPNVSTCPSPLGKRRKPKPTKYYINTPTKSSILKSNWTSNKRSTGNKMLPDVFQTSKVVSPGSYFQESKMWHVVNEPSEADNKESKRLPKVCALVRTQSPWRDDVTSPSSTASTKHSSDVALRRSVPRSYDSSGLEQKYNFLKRPTKPKVVKSVSYSWTGKSVMKREQFSLQGHYSEDSRSTGSSVSSRRLLRSRSKIVFRPLTM